MCCSVSAAMTLYNVQHNVLYAVGSVFLALAIKINLSYADEFLTLAELYLGPSLKA